MNAIPGARPPDPKDLVRVRDRLTFFMWSVARLIGSRMRFRLLTVTVLPMSQRQRFRCCCWDMGVRITHSAVSVLSESGSTIVWVGENGVRYYAHGNPPSRSSRLLEAQARAVSDPSLRLAVARSMYLMRFSGEDVSKLSLQQLRGR